MANPVTGEHVLRKSFSEADQAIKTVPAAATSFAIELSHADGDSVTSVPYGIYITDSSELSAVGIKQALLYADDTGDAKIQVSPVDSGDVWFDVVDGDISAAGSPVMGTLVDICARRIRVSITSGTPTVYLVGQA